MPDGIVLEDGRAAVPDARTHGGAGSFVVTAGSVVR